MPGQVPFGSPMGNPYINMPPGGNYAGGMSFQPGAMPGSYPANPRSMGMPAAGYPMQPAFPQPGMQMMRPAMAPYGQMQPGMGMPMGAGGLMQPQPGVPAPAPQGQG